MSGTKRGDDAERKERFCVEYTRDMCGSSAAIRAGFPKRSAKQKAYILLGQPAIQERIAHHNAKRLRKAEITADRVLAETAKVAFASIADYMRIDEDGRRIIDIDAAPEGTLDAVASLEQDARSELVKTEDGETVQTTVIDVKTKFKLHDKLRALELLGKHLKLFNAGLELPSGPDGETKPVSDLDLVKAVAFILTKATQGQ